MKYNGQEIGIPEVWQIAEYIALKRYDLSAQAVYDKYSKKGWVKSNGGEIKSLEAIVNAQNGVMLENKRKLANETKKERKQRKQEKKAIKKQKRKEYLEKKKREKKDTKEIKVIPKTKDNFIPYDKQLKDKRWRNLRQEIIKERGEKCELCGKTRNLCVHHKVYIKGRYAWEYPKKHLIVLCRECHEKVHGIDLDKRADFLIEND